MSPHPGTSRPGIHEGTRLGHYLVERRLGSGGEATVLLARDVILRRKVALKILHGDKDEPSTIRGLNEARLIATLDHANIVRVYHVERSHGVWFMVMEYIDGGNLAERVRRLGAMDPVRALRAALAVADALDHAHQIGVVHRDLKPQNLLVSRTGAIKLADFGLAAVACLQRAEGGLRQRSGPRVGTPQFAAPELWSGKPATPSSDLYSLGACLYFFLTARAPFTSDTLEGLGEEHLKKEPVPMGGVPVIVADLVLNCLAKDPADRPASARVMCDEIQARIAVLTSDRRRRGRSHAPPPRSARSGAFGASPNSYRYSGGWATVDAALLALPRFAAARQWLSHALLGDAPLILFYGPEPHAHRLLVQGAFEANHEALYEAVLMTLSPAGEGLVDGLLARLELEPAPRPVCYAEIRKALRLLAGSAKPIPAVVIIFLERPLSAAEIADLMQLAAGFAGQGIKILMTSERDAAEHILSHAAAANQPALLRTFFLRRRTLSEGVLYMKARCAITGAPSRRWTSDALRLAAYIGKADPERIVHNALALAELASMSLVTTWCVVGASAHGERIGGEADVLAGWRSPPGAWPPADLLAKLDELRIEMNGEERVMEEVDQADADATNGVRAANEPERS